MSEIHNVNPTTTCGTTITMSDDQHSVAGSTAGHVLEGSERCKRCKRDSHGNSDADSNHNTCSFLCIHVPRRSDDMCCIKHYCVQSSDSFKHQNISLENVTSAGATNRVGKESTGDRGGVATHVELASSVESSGVCGQSQAIRDEGDDGRHAAAGSPGNNGHCEGDDDDEESSNSATSMLRNRKKPRSRLKKFVTSLLSLSSSSSDEEH